MRAPRLQSTVDAIRIQLGDDTFEAVTRDPTRSVRPPTDPVPDPPEPPPARIELLGTLGAGGMGVIRQGRQTALRRGVAVKVLPEENRTPRSIAQLLQEARVTGYLEHPNIVPVHDIEIGPDGSPQVVLEHIHGPGTGCPGR